MVDASSSRVDRGELPEDEVVLGGDRQGAAVAGYTTADSVPAGYDLPDGITGPMPSTVAPHIAAVVLFGTPDPWFLNLVDHSAPPIVIRQEYAGNTYELCASGDPVCFPGGLDRSAHSSYKDNGMAVQAAVFAVNALSSMPPANASVSSLPRRLWATDSGARQVELRLSQFAS